MPTLWQHDDAALDHDPLTRRHAWLEAGDPELGGSELTREQAAALAAALISYSRTPDPGPGAPYPRTQRQAELAAMTYEELSVEMYRQHREDMAAWSRAAFAKFTHRDLAADIFTPASEAPASFRRPTTKDAHS